jgi:hypothetical protein
MMKLDVPYVAYGTSKLTGETVSVAGIWQGISAGQIAHRVDRGAAVSATGAARRSRRRPQPPASGSSGTGHGEAGFGVAQLPTSNSFSHTLSPEHGVYV